MVGHDGVVISGGQPIGDYTGESYCDECGGCCYSKIEVSAMGRSLSLTRNTSWEGVLDETYGMVYPI